jgi:hypothetical protein
MEINSDLKKTHFLTGQLVGRERNAMIAMYAVIVLVFFVDAYLLYRKFVRRP